MKKILLFLILNIFSYSISATNKVFNPPIMGWSSWNTYRVNINEDLIKRQADALVHHGLNKVGYNYINIDDFKNDCNTQVCPSNNIPDGWEGMDAGPETRKAFAAAIKC